MDGPKSERAASPKAAQNSQSQPSKQNDNASGAEVQAFTVANKFRSLEQIAADAELTPLCSKLAIVIASKYLNSKTGDAWPSHERLAADCHVTDRAIRGALGSLKARGHLEITGKGGGRGKTNRYRPVLRGQGGRQSPRHRQ